MKMKIQNGSKKIEIPDVKKLSEFGKIKGLMFCRRENAKPLLFEFKKPSKTRIHSFFVFFSFLAIWLDSKNKVLEYKIVTPFTLSVSPKKNYFKLLEIPFNKKYGKFIGLFFSGFRRGF